MDLVDEVEVPAPPPELREWEQRRGELRKQRMALEDELRSVEHALFRLRNAGSDELDAIAEQLASGELSEVTRDNLPEERAVLRRRLEVASLAEVKAAEHLKEAREHYHYRIAAAARPAHRKAGARIAVALYALADANREEEAIRGLVPGGKLPPMNFPRAGRIGADGGPAEFWAQNAKRYGYLQEPEQPAAAKGVGRLVPRRARKSTANGAAEPAAAMVAKGQD